MKKDFAATLCCPFCRAAGMNGAPGGVALAVREEDEREVREGELTCAGCGRVFPVRAGIPDFLDRADEVLASEVRGWTQLAGHLHEGMVAQVAALPCFPHVPWPHVAPDFFQIFEHVDFAGGRVVDIGAGRTWSTRFLVTIGRASQAVAVDALTARFLGLETAEIFFEQDRSFFERLRADIHHLPLPDGWADAVFSCAAIHHSGDLDALFAEVARVLRPGGVFVFVCEPAKRASIPGNVPQNEETAVGINEHFYSLAEYTRALRRAGLRVRRLVPRTIGYRLLYPDANLLGAAPPEVRWLARRRAGRTLLDRLLRSRAGGAWLYRRWSLPLSAIASKPAR
ncbi:MAG TPA: methyltransferase domain-containing protein [Thermoanaerobaculia bacterium]|nr:methyltransferase domain-containing protein [Thermoanaerobaculia bacterium]